MPSPRLTRLLPALLLAFLVAAPAFPGGDTLEISEVVVTPTAAEFVEIVNPTVHYIDLSNVYLTDATAPGLLYYKIVTGSGAGGGINADFHARFPAGAGIAPGERQTIAIPGSASYATTYGGPPTYELFEDGSPDAVPDLRPALPGSIDTSAPSGISNDGEVVILYQWNGASDLVQDLDYVVWGDKVEAVDKSGVSIDGPDAGSGGSTYAADVAIVSQAVVAAGAHAAGSSFQRTDPSEGSEIATGGNGATGNNEMSENLGTTFGVAARNPQASPVVGTLLLSEIVTNPTAGELIEIWNPNSFAVDLSNVYLTDATAAPGSFYYNLPTGVGAGGGAGGDFNARFPNGASIAAGAYQTIAITGSANFFATYGVNPTYELFEDGAPDAIPDLRSATTGSIDLASGLDPSGEVVVLYHWSGGSDLVGDLDYAVWGDQTEAVDKTGITRDGPDGGAVASAYFADTPIASQEVIAVAAHAGGNSYTRLSGFEGAELQSGGNGVDGADETSEDLASTWGEAAASPGAGSLPGNLLGIADAARAEGNAGTALLSFTVHLAQPAPVGGASFDIATADGTATDADNDYEPRTLLSQVIPAGQQDYAFDVTINGDTHSELDESFTVSLANVSGAGVFLGDGVAVGTIQNDDGIEIYQIQGSGALSALDGQSVTTRGNVVTAVGPQGFFMETPAARDDGNVDTSNGIYVFTSTAPTVTVGQVVDVTGTVDEFFEMTEIVSPTVTVTGSGALPAAVVFDATRPSPNPLAPSCAIEYECYESMRISIASGTVGGPSQFFGTDPIAEPQITAAGRAFREPGVDFPGLGGTIPTFDGNPQVFELDPDKLGLANVAISAGSRFSATGVLGYDFGDYELWPTSLTLDPPGQPLPVRAVRAKSGEEFTIGTLNMLRFYDDVNDPAINDADEDATTTAQFECRIDKFGAYVVQALRGPDVLAVEEVENLAGLQRFATDLQTSAGLTYTARLVEGNDVGGIDVGFLVKNTVSIVSVTQLGKTETLSCDGSLLHDRPPLLLRANYVGGGANFPFAVLVVHLRSRGSIDDPAQTCAANPAVQRVRQKRLEAAQSVAQMVQSFQTANPTVPLVVTGDFNAFEFTDGYADVVGQIRGQVNPAENQISGPQITDPPLFNQALRRPQIDRYSFVFDGSAQVLDHALISRNGVPYVTGFEFGRGNADAARVYVDQGCSPANPTLLPLRASDHDGAVLYLHNGVGFLFGDGFETGTASRWSQIVP